MTLAMTAAQVKSHLVGLDGWFEAARQSGAEYDDTRIAGLIPGAVRYFERTTRYRINQVQISSVPDGVYAPRPAPGAYAPAALGALPGIYGLGSGSMTLSDGVTAFPYLIEQPYAFLTMDQPEYARLSLNETPVLAVQRYRIAWDAENSVFTFPQSWVHFSPDGEVWILPIQGDAIFSSAALSYALFRLPFGNMAYVPGVIAVDYIAGLPQNFQSLNEYADISRKLEECVALQVLEDISETYQAGLLSSSINAFSATQSLNFDRFKSRKAELSASIEGFKKVLGSEHSAFMLECL